MASSEIIRGAKAIAYELRVSVATLHRMKPNLPLRKGCAGGRTSPLEVDRKDIEALKRDRKG
ncbi:hypothetical protein MWN33_05745 [Starkeya koreensis]|uniref:Uncharacterized protein n=1 Tax=Ancylobacter koreensis TaxID=266121 RepID=A0ABT0DK18_9HYPH|nr:hypothetical protein [Ancylobacter koreensis]MCK0207534.1 hypothetical protein [Ancylobacter koreensis]